MRQAMMQYFPVIQLEFSIKSDTIYLHNPDNCTSDMKVHKVKCKKDWIWLFILVLLLKLIFSNLNVCILLVIKLNNLDSSYIPKLLTASRVSAIKVLNDNSRTGSILIPHEKNSHIKRE